MPGSQQAWEYDVTWNPWSADFDFSGENGDQPESRDVVRSAAVSLNDNRRMIEKMNSLTMGCSDSGLKGIQFNGMHFAP